LVFEELLRWMHQPQAAWLRTKGLRPGEGIDAVEDLDPLELNALERYQLLDQNLEPLLVAGTLPDWPSLLAGQGVMPAGAGAALEQQELSDRWQCLKRQLDSLGPCRREGVVIEGVLRPLVFAGETQVVVQAGMLSVRGVMRGWLQHLHLCRLTPTPTAVIARSTRAIGAEIHLHWMALPADQAEEQLVTLQRLAQQGMHQCWPVPPKSGWQMVWHEQRKPGTGLDRFRTCWQEECLSPALQLCFGAELEADALLQTPGFDEACSALYQPLFQARRS
jgi:exodeoxyribonuclease V gamma subunit